MLRFLLNNCQQQGRQYHGIKHIITQPVKDYTSRWHNFRQYYDKAKTNSTVKQLEKTSKLNRIILSGTALTLAFGSRLYLNYQHKIQCEGNHLAMITPPFNWQGDKNNINDDVKFDWQQFWFYLQPHFWELLAAIGAALFVSYINIRIPSLLGTLINVLARYSNTYVSHPINNSFFRDVKRPATNLLSLYVMHALFTFAYIYLLSRIGESMAMNLRQDLFKQIIIQDIEFFDRNRTGELVNRLTADVHDFKSSFKQVVSQGLRSAAQLIGGGISLFLISPHMAAIALASVPAVVMFMSYLGRQLRSLSKKSQAQTERATSVCQEALANVRTVRGSSGEYREMEAFNNETKAAAILGQEFGYGIGIFQGLTNLFLNSLVLSTLFLGGHLMSTESLTPGALMSFLVAAQGLQRSLAQGSILLGTMVRGITAGSRIFEYLKLEPKVKLKEGYEIPEQSLHGEIRFENVYFAYPTRPDQVVLDNFSLILKSGQTVALVGASGSGKSTIAALVERFYEPTMGFIKIDGYKLSYISPYWLRGNVLGFIEQQPILFATTILENIRYGRPSASENDVYTAAKLSQAHDFIKALPHGYYTQVGERGIQLSGGQRQRIAIARALLKNPKILILDEATSALDAASEAEVQKALDKAVVNRTTLVIAHRLSTIRNADLIVVLDKGRIVESGKHEELMARQGLYYDLVRQQERYASKLSTENTTQNTNYQQNNYNDHNTNHDQTSGYPRQQG